MANIVDDNGKPEQGSLNMATRKKKSRSRTQASRGSDKPRLRVRIPPVAIVAVLLLVGAAWLVVWLLNPATLPIRSVQFEGSFRHIETSALKKTVSDEINGGFFRLDIAAIRKRLEKLPWVDRVLVRRVWPDVVQIRVTEQVPVAYWGSKAFINRRGEIFHARARRPLGKLPKFSGPEGSEAVVSQRFNEMNNFLGKIGLKVVQIDVDQRRAWRIRLDNGLRLRLGRRRVLDRLKRFIAVYPVIVARQAGVIEQVDLRYTNGLAVRWRKENNRQPEKSGAVPGGVG